MATEIELPGKLDCAPLRVVLKRLLREATIMDLARRIADRTGSSESVESRNIQRVLSGSYQMIKFDTADRIIIGLGLHPTEVFGKEWA